WQGAGQYCERVSVRGARDKNLRLLNAKTPVPFRVAATESCVSIVNLRQCRVEVAVDYFGGDLIVNGLGVWGSSAAPNRQTDRNQSTGAAVETHGGGGCPLL